METQFTPGPWSINGTYEREIKSADGTLLAVAAGYATKEDTELAAANAMLIAAAPDMFEVIKNLYDWAQANQVFGPIYPKLEAAYLKATGQHFPVTNH